MRHTSTNRFCSHLIVSTILSFFFFFNDTATTEIYTLSLHDALPILNVKNWAMFTRKFNLGANCIYAQADNNNAPAADLRPGDRKSTRLNSSHQIISYAVFCLKKKK